MKEFIHTRIRITRSQDRRESFGWVASISEHQLVVDLQDTEPWVTGEEAQIELIAPTYKALMPSVYCGASSGRHFFSVAKNYQVTVGRFDVRRRGMANQCSVSFEDKTVIADVADVSLYGIALLLPESIDPPTVVNISMTMCPAANWTTELIAKAAYSRIEPKVSSTWRVGFTILQMSRVDALRWKLILDATCRNDCSHFGSGNCIHRRMAA